MNIQVISKIFLFLGFRNINKKNPFSVTYYFYNFFFFFEGIKITVNPESKAVLAGEFVKLCCRATGHPFVQYQWFKMNKEVISYNVFSVSFNSSVMRREKED